MPLTVTVLYENGPESIGDRWENLLSVAFDSNYQSGGMALSLAQMGFAPTADPSFDVAARTRLGYTFDYDYANQLLLAYSGGTQVAGGTNLSTLTGVHVNCRGRFLL